MTSTPGRRASPAPEPDGTGEALSALLRAAQTDPGLGWRRLTLALRLVLPAPWARSLLRQHGATDELRLLELTPLGPEALYRHAETLQLPWSKEDLHSFGQETGFIPWIANVVLGMSARYRWSLPRALAYAIEDEGPLDSLLHATWVDMRHDPGLRALLDELALPTDGPGVALDPGPVGAPRWERLAYLYGRHLIRHTGQGFLGPCPLLRRWLR